MQIISNRQVRFEKTRYEKEVIEGKETGRSVGITEATILVAGDTRPQVVPEWIKDDPHYDMLVDDGQIIEVTSKAKTVKPKTELKGANTEAETPKAAFAGEGKEDKPVTDSGWGAKV